MKTRKAKQHELGCQLEKGLSVCTCEAPFHGAERPANASEHTPGPWKLESSETHGTNGEKRFKICLESGGLIAETSAWWVDTLSAQANARLIASAPELLEALKGLANDPKVLALHPWIEGIIAKAEGK